MKGTKEMKKIIELEKILEEQSEEYLNDYFMVAYLTSKKFDLEGFVFDDCGFDYDVVEIVENLERFGINKIVVTDSSTGLMKALKVFTEAGFQILGMKNQKVGYNEWAKEAIYKNGLILQK